MSIKKDYKVGIDVAHEDKDSTIECIVCGDTGEITVMGRVYSNEPHEAPIDTAPCPGCQYAGYDDEYNGDDL